MKKVPPCLCSSFGFSEQAAEKVGRSVLDARASRLSHGLRRNWGSPAPLWLRLPPLANGISSTRVSQF